MIVAILFLIVATISTAAVVLTAGEVPRGSTVLGINIGGRSVSAAAAQLRAALGKRLTEPVQLSVQGKKVAVNPKDAGLILDVKATVARATKNVVNPLNVLFGKKVIEPVVTVDVQKLYTALQPQIGEVIHDMQRPSIHFEKDGETYKPVPVYGKPGRNIDKHRAAVQLRKKWLRGKAIDLPLGPVPPRDDKSAVDELIKTTALPAIAGPITVHTAEGSLDIAPNHIAESLIMESNVVGKIEPRIDAAKLRESLGSDLQKFGTPGKDAKITIEGGQVKIAPSQEGRGVNIEKLAQPLLQVLKNPAPRTVEGEMGPLPPKMTTEKANSLGIKEKISSFTTNFTGGQDRNKNILLVADEVDNALIMPGDDFSLNEYTGERGPAQGYVKAPVILGGKIKNEYGGGISQFATTLYNAVFFSGLEDVFHKAHGYYISRYPAGREATVYYPSLDLKFNNNSEYGVVIDTSYTNTSITVSFWSTKKYDIESVSGDRTNNRPVDTVYLENEPDCVETAGIPGFDIVVYRVFRQNGQEVKRERIFTSYKAEPKFICGKDPNKGG